MTSAEDGTSAEEGRKPGGVRVVGAGTRPRSQARSQAVGKMSEEPAQPVETVESVEAVEPPQMAQTAQSVEPVEPGAPEERAGSARRRGLRARVGGRLMVVGVFALVGWAGAIGFGLAWAGQSSQASADAAVRKVSTDFVMALTNFTPSTIDSDFSRIIGYSTGTFATQAHQFFDTQIRKQLQTALASSRGQVRHLFVQSLSGNQASVYVVVDQTYVNSKTPTPQADTLRLIIGLTDLSSGWHISSVGVLGTPSGAGSGSGVP